MFPVLWLFGLPSSGKTTLAKALRGHFLQHGRQVVLLDGDELRSGLSWDLGFSDADRLENLRRAAHLAKLLANQGHQVICAFVTPKEHHRERVREVLADAVRFVHIDCPLDLCVNRDVKGLYAKAASNQMTGMTGTQDDFELPKVADMVIRTHETTVHDAIKKICTMLDAEMQDDSTSTMQNSCRDERLVTEWGTHEHRATSTTKDDGGRSRGSARRGENQAA